MVAASVAGVVGQPGEMVAAAVAVAVAAKLRVAEASAWTTAGVEKAGVGCLEEDARVTVTVAAAQVAEAVVTWNRRHD